jgi:hypothetical protein
VSDRQWRIRLWFVAVAAAVSGLVVGCGGTGAVATPTVAAPAIATATIAIPPTAASLATNPPTATPASTPSGAARADFDLFWNTTKHPTDANGADASGATARVLWSNYVDALAKAFQDYDTLKTNPSVIDPRNPNYGLAYHYIIIEDSNKLIRAAQSLQHLDTPAIPATMAPLNTLVARTGIDGQDFGMALNTVFSGELPFAAHTGELDAKAARQRADNDAVSAFAKQYCDLCVSPTR